MASLVEKEVVGFEFRGSPTHTRAMVKHIGEIGKITYQGVNICQVEFADASRYNYPYPEILQHLVEIEPEPEEELTIDEILNNMKNIMLKM